MRLKNIVNSNFLMIYILLLFSACEIILDMDFKQAETKAVLFVGLINNDQSYARLSYSAPVKGEYSNKRYIENADIQLYEDEAYVISFEDIGEGDYILDYDFDISKTYKIKSNTPYGELESEAVNFYAEPKINSLKLSVLKESDTPQLDEEYLVSIELYIEEDIPYYAIEIQGIAEGELYDYVNEYVLQEDEIKGPCTPALFITNSCFINQYLTVETAVRKNYGQTYNNPDGQFDGYQIEVYSLNESAYNDGLHNINYDFLDLFFGEPSAHYSNINGAYGVVIALNKSTKQIFVH